MEIIESWEDDKGGLYAIVKHSKKEQQQYKVKEFEAMYMMDGELQSFGGSVGYNIADFPTYKMAEDFMLMGFSLQDEMPDIWLDMVQV